MLDPLHDQNLSLLTTAEAAAILKIDVKTLRAANAPFITIGKSRRYTRALLQGWIEKAAKECPPDPAQSDRRGGGKRPARNISRGGPVRLTGKSRSGSTIIEFERVAGLKID